MKIDPTSARKQLKWYLNHLAGELDDQITACQLIQNYMVAAKCQQYISLVRLWREVLHAVATSASELTETFKEGGEEGANG